MGMARSEQAFYKSPFASLKHKNYFPIYDELLNKFVEEEITIVEVGVLGGGSLFMWRDFFGPRARIIGIDANPASKKWIAHGFEIFIGDQASPEFWRGFFSSVGKIDVLIDDGGHTNLHQSTTVASAIKHIKDGGVIIIEDVHSSYLKDFGNPSKYSFINYSKNLIDVINSRFHMNTAILNEYSNSIWEIRFYESIVAFVINRQLSVCNESVGNEGIYESVEDFRYRTGSKLRDFLVKSLRVLSLKYDQVGNTNFLFRPLNLFVKNTILRNFFFYLFIPLVSLVNTLLNAEFGNRRKILVRNHREIRISDGQYRD